MKKLKLNLDEIKVESFETLKKQEKTIGTILAQVTGDPCNRTGPYYPTCGIGSPTCYWACSTDEPEGCWQDTAQACV